MAFEHLQTSAGLASGFDLMNHYHLYEMSLVRLPEVTSGLEDRFAKTVALTVIATMIQKFRYGADISNYPLSTSICFSRTSASYMACGGAFRRRSADSQTFFN